MRVGVVLLLLTALAGCADHPRAPIEDRTGRPSSRSAQSSSTASTQLPNYGAALQPGKPYSVRKGDTLYSIAFRLGMDYRDLARLNNIAAPYTIFIGQKLRTAKGTSVAKSKTPAAKPKTTSPPKTASSSGSPAVAPPTVPKALPKPAPKVAAKSAQSRATPKPSPSTSTPAPSGKSPLGAVTSWLWPAEGKVARGYSTNLHKGVDIAGQRGAIVRSAAPGVVVYAGTGVKGYGALLIVKHNEQYLSAYGHNDVILVREGDRVSAGQQIARMGSTGTDTVKLHFEIRKLGQPIDPLKMLPRR